MLRKGYIVGGICLRFFLFRFVGFAILTEFVRRSDRGTEKPREERDGMGWECVVCTAPIHD